MISCQYIGIVDVAILFVTAATVVAVVVPFLVVVVVVVYVQTAERAVVFL